MNGVAAIPATPAKSTMGGLVSQPGPGPLPEQTLVALNPALDASGPMSTMVLDRVHWGAWNQDQVDLMVCRAPQSTFVLDVRSFSQAELDKDQKNVYRIINSVRMVPSTNEAFVTADTVAAALAAFKKTPLWPRLLAAKYVVVHCQQGQERSPLTMAALYQELGAGAGKTIAGRDPSQRIGLLNGGMSIYPYKYKEQMARSLVHFSEQQINAAKEAAEAQKKPPVFCGIF